MTAFIRTSVKVGKLVADSCGFVAAFGFAALEMLGAFRVDFRDLSYEHGAVLLGWSAVFMLRLKARLRCGRASSSRAAWLDLQLGLLALVLIFALLDLSGGPRSVLYPMLYLLAALWGALTRPRVAAILIILAVAFEALTCALDKPSVSWGLLSLHAIALFIFGLSGSLLARVKNDALRLDSDGVVDDELRRVQEEARILRLAGAPDDSLVNDDGKLCRTSVERVHKALFYDLQLLKRTLQLHSCVLLMRDRDSDQVRVIDAATDSTALAEGPFCSGEGAVGCAEKRGEVVNLEHLRPAYQGICYYREPAGVKALIALPVKDGERVCGALCADRLEDRGFSAVEEGVLQNAADHMVGAMENQRVLVQLERAKREQTVLHKASQAFGAAPDEKAVLDAAFEAAREIARFDFAAVTQYDAVSGRHWVRRAIGEGADALADLSFPDNASLTAMAVKNRHYLPYRGVLRSGEQVVYTRKADLVGMGSLLILPLVVRESAIGTLALGTRRRDAFGPALRPSLQVLSNQLAVALSNADLVAKLEEQATTDALTGCSNRRVFQEEFDLKLRAAQRFGRKVSLVVTDLDHFKSVNDTYGHSVGDAVLKELGEILRRVKRETDLVARIGGEEFCLVCEETDTTGAVRLAERVREELEATVFHTELGKLKVTCSAGIATYPDQARDRQILFELADRAMYAAKQAGRNRVLSVAIHRPSSSDPLRPEATYRL